MPEFNYVNAVQENVRQEFDEFFAEEMQKPKEEIFNDSYKIRFYTELNEFLTANNDDFLGRGEYRCLYEEGTHVIASLYDHYLYTDYASINTWDDVRDMVRTYNDRHYSDLLEEFEAE